MLCIATNANVRKHTSPSRFLFSFSSCSASCPLVQPADWPVGRPLARSPDTKLEHVQLSFACNWWR